MKAETLIGAIAGVFVGALVMEVLHRKKPDLAQRIEKKAKDTVESFTTAFKEGWECKDAGTEAEESTIQPEEAPA